MISYYSIFWVALISLDLLLARRLYEMYHKDAVLRKLMLTIGLLMCIPIYSIAIVGIDSFPLAMSIFYWCPLPVLLAFLLILLNDRFNLDIKKCYRVFMVGTACTFALFFFPSLTILAWPLLIAGVAFAIVLVADQCIGKFDLASVTLYLAIPCFTVCIAAIGYGMEELALFSGFVAKATLLIAFEIPKSQGTSSSILVLKKQLGLAEENFSNLFNTLPDPAVIVDGKGTFLALTPSIATITGFQQEELLGINFFNTELVTASSKVTLVKNLAKRMLGFHVEPYEVEVLCKDGRKMQFELNAMKIKYNGNPADMVIFRDLTERNRLIKSLEKEQQRFQGIAESTGDWIWEVDSEGNYVYSNPVVEKILGYTPEEVVGQKCCNLLCKDDDSQTELARALSAGKKSFAFTKRCSHKDGNISILESQGVAVCDEDGKFLGYRGVDRDITERKKMEEKLLKSERLAAIGGLATMVAHDLRNPLQGISYSTHYIKKATENLGNEKMVFMLNLIDEDIKYSEKIIRDLLDFSAEYKLDLIEIALNPMVSQALTGMAIPDKVKVIDKTQDEPKIYVDVDRIRRVIVNLVSNAFEAMPNGGTLTITSKQAKDCVELSFTDTGTGIAKEKMDKLWTPFVTTKAKGMGLGLPICKRIVEAHGGQILVESEKNKGTTFTIVIPTKSEKNNVELHVKDTEAIPYKPSEVTTTLAPLRAR